MSFEQNSDHLSKGGIAMLGAELQDMCECNQNLRDLGSSFAQWPEQRALAQMRRAFGMYNGTVNKVAFQDLAKSLSSSIQASSESTVHAVNQLFRQIDDSYFSLIESYQNAISVNKVQFKSLLPSLSNLIFPSLNLPLPDIGASSVFSQLAMSQSAILDQVRHLLKLGIKLPDYSQLAWRSLPLNLRLCRGELNLDEIICFLQHEGIPLYLVPRKRIVTRLVRAENTAMRRQVLSSCHNQIVEDCASVIEAISKNWAGDELAFVDDAIGAMRAGFTQSAQAMLTSVLDTLIRRFVPDPNVRRSLTNRQNGANAPDLFNDLNLRQELVWLPIWNAHQAFWIDKGDRIPRVYSRHASVHGVSKRQFSKRNCVQVLMLVTSLVGYHAQLSSYND